MCLMFSDAFLFVSKMSEHIENINSCVSLRKEFKYV